MKAGETNLLKFLQKPNRFVIPIYQRNYSWSEHQCTQLLNDIVRIGSDEKVSSHFIGSIVYVEEAMSTVTTQEPLLVIDGQQRLTTITLLLSAIRDYICEKPETIHPNAFTSKKLNNYYLTNPNEDGENYYKLTLLEADRDALVNIIDGNHKADCESARIENNYKLFYGFIQNNPDMIGSICHGIEKLVVVDVALDRSKDNPQLIFESLNSTGLALSQADLIRNYILMSLDVKTQAKLYKNHWRPMERDFGQTSYATHFDPFMRNYLTIKNGEIPNMRDIYTTFKEYASKRHVNINDLIEDLHNFSSHYCAVALGKEKDIDLKRVFSDLRELRVDVTYPLLLELYNEYKNNRLEKCEFLAVCRLVESYVFRRTICGIPTNSLNKTFAGILKSMDRSNITESVHAMMALMPSYRRFPTDEEFVHHLKSRDLYNFRNRSYLLRRLENHGKKEHVMIENYTIEHIMPQNENLSQEWINELGRNWKEVHSTLLHTIGNLTLTGYNSEYSDHSFSYKRNEVKSRDGEQIGFSYSPLLLNKSIANVEKWNDEAILKRAELLCERAKSIWSKPSLDDEALEKYQIKPQQKPQNYTMNDHPHLLKSEINDLFNSVRNEIIALDPCVNEEYLKLYIAYKTETNFVDIIPQAKRLSLVLNMDIGDIEDPHGLCEDISNVGTWGNGNVRVHLNKHGEIPYVMGLIRQSFERSMEA